VSRPLLFLDVDGVLNSARHRGGVASWGMDDFHVNELARVVRRTGCEIVVSSAWRRGGIGQGSQFREVLCACKEGPTVLRAVIGRTPFGDRVGLGDDFQRCQEIAHWLGEFRPDGCRFAIVDDDAGAGIGMSAHFVQTDICDGLTPDLADRLIEILSEDQA
jgi:hypothetical protein